jgi:hypothetical protein
MISSSGTGHDVYGGMSLGIRDVSSSPMYLYQRVSRAISGCYYVKTGFGNGCRSPLVMGNAPVTDQVLQISQER